MSDFIYKNIKINVDGTETVASDKIDLTGVESVSIITDATSSGTGGSGTADFESGTFAARQIQDLIYDAVDIGSDGNNITIQYIGDGSAGSETVDVTGDAIEVHIGTNISAVAASKIVQDLTYTATTAGLAGNDISIEYINSTDKGNVDVTGDAITVDIGTGASAEYATLTEQDLTFDAVDPGEDGNDITVEYVEGTDPGNVDVVGDAITVDIGTDAPGSAASVVIQDLTYVANTEGTDGNNITIQYIGGTDQGNVDVTGDAILLDIGTSGSGSPTNASAVIQDITYTAVSSGTGGNAISVTYTDTTNSTSIGVVGDAITAGISSVGPDILGFISKWSGDIFNFGGRPEGTGSFSGQNNPNNFRNLKDISLLQDSLDVANANNYRYTILNGSTSNGTNQPQVLIFAKHASTGKIKLRLIGDATAKGAEHANMDGSIINLHYYPKPSDTSTVPWSLQVDNILYIGKNNGSPNAGTGDMYIKYNTGGTAGSETVNSSTAGNHIQYTINIASGTSTSNDIITAINNNTSFSTNATAVLLGTDGSRPQTVMYGENMNSLTSFNFLGLMAFRPAASNAYDLVNAINNSTDVGALYTASYGYNYNVPYSNISNTTNGTYGVFESAYNKQQINGTYTTGGSSRPYVLYANATGLNAAIPTRLTWNKNISNSTALPFINANNTDAAGTNSIEITIAAENGSTNPANTMLSVAAFLGSNTTSDAWLNLANSYGSAADGLFSANTTPSPSGSFGSFSGGTNFTISATTLHSNMTSNGSVTPLVTPVITGTGSNLQIGQSTNLSGGSAGSSQTPYTATQVKAALDGDGSAASLVNISITGAGTNVQTPQGPTNLTGGVEEEFTLTATEVKDALDNSDATNLITTSITGTPTDNQTAFGPTNLTGGQDASFVATGDEVKGYVQGFAPAAALVNVSGSSEAFQFAQAQTFLENGADSIPGSTANQIETAITNSGDASDLVFVSVTGAGTNVQTPISPTNLTGGVDSDIDLVSDTITISAHPFTTGDEVTFTTNGSPPAPLVNGSNYFIISLDANTIQLAETEQDALDGTAIDLVSYGFGEQELNGGGSASANILIMFSNDGENWFTKIDDQVSGSEKISNTIMRPAVKYMKIEYVPGDTLTASSSVLLKGNRG